MKCWQPLLPDWNLWEQKVTNNSQKVIDLIHESTARKGPLGLDRMKRLLNLLGNPEKRLKIFHVTGTNGKGSVTRYLSSVLQSAGYRVGSFTSPHVMIYNERFAIDDHLISDNAFVRYGMAVLSYNEWLNQEGYGYLSEFEILTAISYLFFAEHQVDYVVCEVGLGGVIDSTNTIENPVSTIITQVGKDHVAMLGETLPEIAWNKGGIIKPRVPVISESPEEEVKRVLRWKAQKEGAPFLDASEVSYQVTSFYPRSVFSATIGDVSYENLALSMHGEHQVRNAIAAVMALQVATKEGKIRVTEEHIRQGLDRAKVMGRFEFLQERDPAVILDGGHNPSGVRAAMNSLTEYLNEGLPKTDLVNNDDLGSSNGGKMRPPEPKPVSDRRRVLIVFGCFKDKEYDEMVSELAKAPEGTHFIVTEPESERAMAADVLAGQLAKKGFLATAIPDEKEAYEVAVNGCYDVVLFVGSIYLIGDMRILYQTKGW